MLFSLLGYFFCMITVLTTVVVLLPSFSNISTFGNGRPGAGSAKKETSWAVPRLFGITQRVPVAVVVLLTGEHFGFVMLDFFSVRFCSGNDRRHILCWRCFFRDR